MEELTTEEARELYGHKWEWGLSYPMVLCGLCGNNCDNGSYGEIAHGPCPACPSAYDLQDNPTDEDLRIIIGMWKDRVGELMGQVENPPDVPKVEGTLRQQEETLMRFTWELEKLYKEQNPPDLPELGDFSFDG